MDHIEQVAKLLKRGETVIFYAVGTDTFLCIRELKSRFGLLPSAVCDGDPKKQGRSWRGLEGLTVCSPDEAIERYPEAKWLIPSMRYRFQIIGYLTEERGIAPERIVNYEPVRKYRSCQHLQQSVFYDRTGELSFCCNRACPRTAAGEQPDAAGLRALRDHLLRAIEDNQVPEESLCAGCDLIKEDYFPLQPKAIYVNYFCNSVCNYRCSYCNVPRLGAVAPETGRHSPGEVVNALRQAGMLSEAYNLDFVTGGEPTLYPKRKEVFQEFDGNWIGLFTNGYLYEPDWFELMNRKSSYVLDSIDAGTRETYLRIKGVDGFDRVRQNLKKYAEGSFGIVILKYIFVPGVNDSPEDIDGFVDFCVETAATYAISAVDQYNLSRITEQTREMARRLVLKLEEQGILCVPFTANMPEKRADVMRSLAVSAEDRE